MKTISLNILLTYPVKWKRQQVLRDFVQNFYDDIGFRDFNEKFNKKYMPEEEKAVLSIASKGFDYEWLLHIGASTKQGDPGKYAGYFGEGFKMAALCALRDHHWTVTMRSRCWSIEVCVIETEISGTTLKQLAYNVEEGLPYKEETVLEIGNFSSINDSLLDAVILGFFYPENPLIGSLIYESKYAAIYERSKALKPEYYPTSFETTGDGIIFIGYQARGEFVKPLVICNHRFKTPDRERNDLYLGTVLDMLIDLVDLIDVKASCYLLEQFQKYWYDYPESRRDVKSWYSLIRKLIRKTAYFDNNPAIKTEFRKRYPDLVVCEQPAGTHARNQKTQALAWRKIYLPDSRLVQDSFSMLGYKTLIDLCKEAGGFNVTRKPALNELPLLDILQCAAKEILNGFIIDFPPCRIIENDSSVYRGTAIITKNKSLIYNKQGMRVRYTLAYVDIKRSLLGRDTFSVA